MADVTHYCVETEFLADPVGKKDENDPEKQTGIHIVLLRKTDGKRRVVKAIYNVICFFGKEAEGLRGGGGVRVAIRVGYLIELIRSLLSFLILQAIT